MISKSVLAVLALFKWVFPLLRVNYSQLRTLVSVKLLMDTRRDYQNINVKTDAKTGKTTNALNQLLGLHLFTGGMLIYLVYHIKSLFVCMLLFHMILLALTLISLLTNFTSVLLDTSDNSILLPRPIDGRTLFMARSVHILTYLFVVSGALALPGFAYGTYLYGPLFALAALISLVLGTLLAYFCLYFLFFVVLSLTNGRRFREILTLIEIVVPLAITVIFFIRAETFDPKAFSISPQGLTYFLPPAWLAGLMEAVVHGGYQAPYIWHILLAVCVPLVCMLVVVLVLAPAFDRKLAQMDLMTARVKTPRPGYTVASFLAMLLGRGRYEKAGFQLIWKLTARNRKYKLNTDPMVGAAFMFIGMVLFTTYNSVWEALYMLPGTRLYLGMIYASGLVYLAAVSQLPFSDNFKAVWIYRILPIGRPGRVLAGAFKAVMVKFSIPALFVIGFVLSIWGIRALDGLLFGLVNLFLLSLNMAFVFMRMLPFSQQASAVAIGDKLMVTIGYLALFAALGVGHYYLINNDYVVAGWAATACLFGLCLFLYRVFKNTSWETINARTGGM